ncbi:MAG: TlpA family protein disulfide reductase [Candidatus Marinimicrobia bacterium]|nr:TlpA family protein disulfide reductase [Candidatus Neomarinimicrobiota bacterium]MBT3617689.1 TlpA family protein disulfide reductase [Candidatus Neomarinimicrobiota bacterium]MBT3829037.1 TlpA family protein disulfide reductase [Candidatus Neomarinimicrobiota bacterium]MBT3997781.1 TlpA family protein disulfide reductase [Candidatus Neomarinimicrobiota bacterium]MBT4281332.1 TlpA family protein disulfide reductase [Candidatus Neomarinimicrobiota bacterium]
MKFRIYVTLAIFGFMTLVLAQEEAINEAMEKDDSKDLMIGQIAPKWALKTNPDKINFEFLRKWTVGKDERLLRPQSQPNRHAVLMSFFATWCSPCMKELPILEEVYKKYKDKQIKFFLIDITEATRGNPGYENMPKAGPFLKEKGVTMEILYDLRGKVMENYNAQTLPRLFIVDGYQTLRMTRKGFHEGEEEIFKKELSEIIDELLAELPDSE